MDVTTTPVVSPAEQAQQTPPVLEQSKKEVEEAKVKEDPLSSKYAVLAKREKAVQQAENELKKLKKQLEEQSNEWKPISERKAKAKEDPFGWLEAAGLTPDDVIERAIEQHTKGQKPASPVEKKISALESQIKDLLDEKESRKTREEEEKKSKAAESFKESIKQRVEEKADEYELIRSFKQYETVYNVIEAHYGESGEVMDLDEACDLVENHLMTKAQEEAKLLWNTKKLKGKLTFEQALEAKDTSPEVKRETQTKTLTNQASQESAPTRKTSMTDDERLEEAAKLLRFAKQ